MLKLWLSLLFLSFTLQSEESAQQKVITTKGLVAFWDFETKKDGVWTSFYDAAATDRIYPVHLSQIGDHQTYSEASWPYLEDEAKLLVDKTGPFGHAVRFNQGHVYGQVLRRDFDRTALDLSGKKAHTLMAWIKFVGRRHLIAGIWDEGGWDKYAGGRQIALFGGLFGRKGVIAHISATGAASFPQSMKNGSQYARLRALDGADFENETWVCTAMSYDPDRNEVKAYLNGVMTPLDLVDTIAKDALGDKASAAANPFYFESPIYAPTSFLIKYHGYDLKLDTVLEHSLVLDFDAGELSYQRILKDDAEPKLTYRLFFDIIRTGKSLFENPLLIDVSKDMNMKLPESSQPMTGDVIKTSLMVYENQQWRVLGKEIEKPLMEGAPFTFGRALGLGSEEKHHGSCLYVDGVAVFNRVLNETELKKLAFVQ